MTQIASPAKKFTIDCGTINLTGPSNGTEISLTGASAGPTLTWSDSLSPWTSGGGKEGKYLIQISTAPGFDKKSTYVLPSARGQSASSLTLDAKILSRLGKRLHLRLDDGDTATLHWRVCGRDRSKVLVAASVQVRTLTVKK